MLSPQELELLTAHVDGEPSAAQRRQVAGLLERSGEAREMLTWLEADSARLRAMPRLRVPFDLSGGVLEEIGRLARRPKPVPAARITKFPVWRGVAAAAAVLAAVGVGSFVYNSRGPRTDGGGNAVAANAETGDPVKRPDPDNASVVTVPPDKGDSKTIAKSDTEGSKTNQGKSPGKANTPTTPSDVIAANGVDHSAILERIVVDLPTVARLHDLHQHESAKSLTERLGQLKTARVELTARDGAKAFDRVRAALEGKKVKLHIDPVTEARLKKAATKTDVVVFVENIHAEDVVAILREVGVADAAGEKHLDGAVVVKELAQWDRRGLTDILGVDPLLPKRTKPKAGVDIRRELPEQTVREVVAALDGQGVPRPGAEAAHHAYVSHLPATKSRPAELQRWLSLRQPNKPKTLQVLLIVLRHVG